MSKGPEYESLSRLFSIKNRVDNLVCLSCGVPVVDKEAHDMLHSIMSSWAWAIAVLKVNHASEEIHDKWNIIPRVDSKRFGNNNVDGLSFPEKGNDQENTNPAGAKKSPDRYEIAWRIWCWQQRYYQKEDRDAILEIADLAVRMARGENHE